MEQIHGYPFFIQVWGDCLARKLDDIKETEVSMETVKAAEVAVTVERNAMYQVRRNEINDMGLLSVAESIAEAFLRGGEAQLYERTLERCHCTGNGRRGVGHRSAYPGKS